MSWNTELKRYRQLREMKSWNQNTMTTVGFPALAEVSNVRPIIRFAAHQIMIGNFITEQLFAAHGHIQIVSEIIALQ